jgi:hypothetical protein
LVSQSVLIVSDGAFSTSRVQTLRKGKQLRREFGVFQFARNECTVQI